MANSFRISSEKLEFDRIYEFYNTSNTSLAHLQKIIKISIKAELEDVFRYGLERLSISQSLGAGFIERVQGMTIDGVNEFFFLQKEELGTLVMFDLLSAVESMFQRDFIEQVVRGEQIYVDKYNDITSPPKKRWMTIDDIFDVWTACGRARDPLVFSTIKAAFNFRHWVAHGRYWHKDDIGNKYSIHSIFEIAESVNELFP